MKSKLLVLPLMLAVAGAGCFSSGSTPAAAPGASSGSSPVAMPGSSNTGGCTNPYYPFKVGSTIVYKTTYGTTNSEYSMEVQPAASPEIHRLVYTFTTQGRTFPITQEFTCENGGIRATGQLDMATAMGGSSISYDTDSVEGPFMPADMSVGATWETTYNVTVRTSNGMLASMNGKRQSTRIKNTVVGEETITVEAGTYRALKVKMEINITSELLPNPIQTITDTWFVKDIGMVKSVSTSRGTQSTTEAKSVTGF